MLVDSQLTEMKDSEIKALVTLLEDEDYEIFNHVREKLKSLGSGAIPYLESEWETNFDPTLQKRIEDLVHDLQFELLKERLEYWHKNEKDDILKGMWIVATYQYPDLELSDLEQQLEQLYYNTWLNFKSELAPSDEIRILNQCFFDDHKFRANTKNFHSPGNSMINIVLESKRGNPISLCVIYMLIAQKLNLPVYGVNLPNLFILTYKMDDVQFYINVFNRGLIFSKQDIDSYIDHIQVPHEKMFYEPCDHADIIRRILRNLIVSFEKLGEYEKSEEIKELMLVIGDTVI